MKSPKNALRISLLGIAFLFFISNTFAQTKQLKRPKSKVGVSSVDNFVGQSFDIYDKVYKYAMPIVVVGLLFSIYHNLLMFGIIPESVVPCVQGVPCSTEYINWFGFITIPFLSLVSYSIIFFSLLMMNKGGSKNEK